MKPRRLLLNLDLALSIIVNALTIPALIMVVWWAGLEVSKHYATPKSTEVVEQQETITSYSLSSSGIRHNSSCKYYRSDKPCSASDGRACKVCGG